MSDIEGIDRRLHRLYDGDLSLEEHDALEKEIAASPELTKKLEGLREVGVVVRAARTDDAPIDGDALWKAIDAQIAQPEETPARAPLRAITGGAAANEDPRARRRRWIGIGVGTFAIAAAALLMIYDARRHDDVVAEVEPVAPPDTTTTDDIAPPTPPAYTEVLAVDFGTNIGTIFSVEGEGGQRYAVVWLDDVHKHDEGTTTAIDGPVAPD